MCDEEGSPEQECMFNTGWVHKFKLCNQLHNKFSGESASADCTAAENFPSELQKIISKGGYKPQQVFNADEMKSYLHSWFLIIPTHPELFKDAHHVKFLTPNTSLIQPLDQGVTKTFKRSYT